jgi:flavin reductase (DIM6/NTAB) family NADH-FMN oxidoreductase RutF
MSSPARSVSPTLFRQACGRWTTGVAIATTRDAQGEPHGLTVNSFTSVSLDPPLVLICIDRASQTLRAFRDAPGFALNVLAEHQRDLSQRFAQWPESRFQGVKWSPGEHTGSPVLEGALCVMECAKENWIEAGDHWILVGRVVGAETAEGQPLLYFTGQYRAIR